MLSGQTPVIGPPYVLLGLPFGALADQVMAMLTAVALAVGMVGALRAQRWVKRRATGGSAVAVLRCLPYGLAILLPLALPLLLSVVNRGAAVPWRVIFAAWPPLPIFIAVAALASGAVLAARGWHATQWRRSSPA